MKSKLVSLNGRYRAINPIIQAFDEYSWEQFYRRRIYQTRAWSWWQWKILFRQTLQFYTHSCFIKTFYIWGNLYFHIILWYDIRHDLLMLINIFANPLKKSRSYGYSVHATCFIPFELQRRLFDISLLHLFSNFICRTRNSSLRSRYLKFTKFTQSAKVELRQRDIKMENQWTWIRHFENIQRSWPFSHFRQDMSRILIV